MSELTIRTNNVPRDPLYWFELTAKEQADFDYLDTEEKQLEATFVRYRGIVYHLAEFERASEPLEAWHGYHGDSFFSGIVIRYVENFERVICGTYYC